MAKRAERSKLRNIKEKIEVIIIDLFDEYKQIKSYIKENGGLSSARNFGIKRATGEFIGFVDSDDLWSPYFLESLYGALKANNADITILYNAIYNLYFILIITLTAPWCCAR